MASFDDALIELFASNFDAEQGPETTEAYNLLVAQHGGIPFAQTREVLSRWRHLFRSKRNESKRDQVIYCLNAIRRAHLSDHKRLVRELALKSLGQGWSAEQLTHFARLEPLFADGHDFFLSFSGRNPNKDRAVLRVNRDYDAFIGSVLTQNHLSKANRASDNLLAGAVNALLVEHRLDGFYYPDRLGDSTELKKKLDQACRRSFSFVQLLDNEMLMPQDRDVENYCYWEYKLAESSGLNILFLFPYARREDLLPPEDRAEEFADWYDRVAQADLRVLPLARESDPVKLDRIIEAIAALADQIKAARRDQLSRIPA